MTTNQLGNPLFRRAVKRGLAGLKAPSTGQCPGCPECADSEGLSSEDHDRAWHDGKLDSDAHFFSWSPCNICGTRLGGDREVWHWLDSDDALNHGDSACTDCVLYLANGDEPEIDVRQLDKFTRAYLECVLFSSTDEDGGDPLDRNYFVEDFAEESLALAIRDCLAFQDRMSESLAEGTSEAGGHDFWFTRNGHGAGFWDGDWPEPAASLLDGAAKLFGEQTVYVVGDDGKIYLDQVRALPVGWIAVVPLASRDVDLVIAMSLEILSGGWLAGWAGNGKCDVCNFTNAGHTCCPPDDALDPIYFDRLSDCWRERTGDTLTTTTTTEIP